eukprot:gene7568-7069_t
MTCTGGISGNPIATCQANGAWVYSGSCAYRQTTCTGTTCVGNSAAGFYSGYPTCGPCNHPSGSYVSLAGCNSPYHYGSTCSLSCGSGYYGNPTAWCGSTGTWTYGGYCQSSGPYTSTCGAYSHPNSVVYAPSVCN